MRLDRLNQAQDLVSRVDESMPFEAILTFCSPSMLNKLLDHWEDVNVPSTSQMGLLLCGFRTLTGTKVLHQSCTGTQDELSVLCVEATCSCFQGVATLWMLALCWFN
jgi:hypothetical protein